MPPKRKLCKIHGHSSDGQPCCSGQTSCSNPHVVLQPFMRDESSRKRYRFTALPASAAMYNKSEMSDVRICVQPTGKTFYAHRVILSGASEVFSAMLGSAWLEARKPDLELHEEADCARVFDRFLYFIYSGNVIIGDDYVVPLFVLSGKYDIRSLHEECAKLIERALKVFIFGNSGEPSTFSSSSDSSLTDSSDSEMSDCDAERSMEDWGTRPMGASRPRSKFVSSSISAPLPPNCSTSTSNSKIRSMVASETFPVAVVLRLLELCHGNERVYRAALLNLEARVGNQICLRNFSLFVELSQDVIVSMLNDSRFGYPEMLLFEAVENWLRMHSDLSANPAVSSSILTCIRYPLLTTSELYEVEGNPLVQSCPEASALVHDAMRHRLFRDCCTLEDRARWAGLQFAPRSIPHT